MIKVKLKKGIRFFNEENTNFDIKVGEELFIKDRELKDTNIKAAILKGTLEIVEGEAIISIKGHKYAISPKEIKALEV